MIKSCSICASNCENVGKTDTNACKKFKMKRCYEITTDQFLEFPDIIIVQSTQSNMSKVYVRQQA